MDEPLDLDAEQELPLHGVRILSIEQYGAGPWATLQLADLGADVVKIELLPDGDIGRAVPPFQIDGDSLFFQSFNRNKSSLALDLRNPADRLIFEDLVTVSDAVFSNLRGDVAGQLKLRYDDLRHVNPKIVCCSLSAFGGDGPRAAQPGYDYAIQALGGWMSLTGETDGPPAKSGLSLVDFSGGYVAALSLMIGIFSARQRGVGMDCDVSLFDTALSLLNYVGTWAMSAGYVPERRSLSAHPSMAPFQLFATSDDWVVVACAKEKFWRKLVRGLDIEELRDPIFSSFALRYENFERLSVLLGEAFGQRTSAEWVAVLDEWGVPASRVNTVVEALQDPQVDARDMIVEVEHQEFGRIRMPAVAVKVGRARKHHKAAPPLGEVSSQPPWVQSVVDEHRR